MTKSSNPIPRLLSPVRNVIVMEPDRVENIFTKSFLCECQQPDL